MTTKTVEKNPYKATLTVMGKKFTATGSSVADVIDKLRPGGVAGRAVLAVSKGKVTKERVMYPFFTRKLFTSQGTMRQILLKQVTTLFDI